MASKIARATGNFTAAGTWAVVDANGYVDSENTTTPISTTALTTPNFTPGIINTDGVLLKLAARAASPTGTFTVTLRNTSLGSDVTSTTINVSDLPSAGLGWFFIKWSGTQMLMAATNYAIKVVCSNTGSQVTLYRSATTDDFSKMICTTTTGAPAASDQLIIVGEYTGAGTSNAFTVTMNNTATTTWGATSFVDSIAVGALGTMTCGVTASTAYYLKYAGKFTVSSGGTVNFGTSGSRMPSTSSLTVEMSVASNVDTGLVCQNGSTFNAYGNSITAYQTLLNTDEAAASTVLGVASTSGWANGDEIAIASTTRTSTQHEKRTISTVDSSTQVTVTSGLTNAHSGTSPTQAEVIHLTRNVKIRGTSASLQGYVWFDDTSTVVCDSVEFSWLGSATTNKRGVDIQTTTGSCTITGCSFHEFSVASSTAMFISGSASNNITISNSVVWSVASNGIDVSAATTGTSISATNLLVVGAAVGFSLLDLGITLTSCVATSCTSNGFTGSETVVNVASGTFSDLSSHSNGGTGLTFSNLFRSTMSNLISWRNTGVGLNLNAATVIGGTIDGLILFGNTTSNLTYAGRDFTVKNMTASGDSTFATTNGVSCNSNGSLLLIENSSFGAATGIKTNHTSDVVLGSVSQIVCRDCLFESPTEISITATVASNVAGVFSQKHDQTAGLHKRYTVYGNATTETTTFNTASPSEKLSPLSATVKFRSSVMRCAVANGATVTISVYVRKNSSYNGNAPRLRLLANPAIGIDADVTIDTFSVGADTWEQLTGTTAAANDDGVCEFVVDCDGTAGSIFVDDWAAS